METIKRYVHNPKFWFFLAAVVEYVSLHSDQIEGVIETIAKAAGS